MKIAANIPCIIFPYKYGFIDRSVLEVMLNTCRKTEIPPKPSKKAVKITFKLIALICIEAICLMPFVISSSPVSNGIQKEELILKSFKIGLKNNDNKLNMPLLFKIDIKLEKITMKPPIISIVFVLLVILSANIFPRLDTVTCSLDDVFVLFVLLFELLGLN